jgi:hypothetical protein
MNDDIYHYALQKSGNGFTFCGLETKTEGCHFFSVYNVAVPWFRRWEEEGTIKLCPECARIRHFKTLAEVIL